MPGAFYDDAVAWSFDTGVTKGVGSTRRFVPHAGVTRAEVATFLHRAAGTPEVTVVEACPNDV